MAKAPQPSKPRIVLNRSVSIARVSDLLYQAYRIRADEKGAAIVEPIHPNPDIQAIALHHATQELMSIAYESSGKQIEKTSRDAENF